MLESTEYFGTTSEGALIWEAQESDCEVEYDVAR